MHDAPLLRLAGRQHGLVAMRQLVPLGYTEHHIRWRIRVGLLFRVYRGVYAVAGSADTFEFRVMAAVLAAGDGAVASHRCAAVLYGLRRVRCDRPSITVAGRGAPELDGVDRHRRDTLTAVDRARVGVIPVTAPAWTLLDLAGDFNLANDVERGRLGGALDDVLVRKLASLRAIERLLERVSGRRVPGAAALAELVAERRAGKNRPRRGWRTNFSRSLRPTAFPSRSGNTSFLCLEVGRHASMPPIPICCWASRPAATPTTEACSTGCATKRGTMRAGGWAGRYGGMRRMTSACDRPPWPAT